MNEHYYSIIDHPIWKKIQAGGTKEAVIDQYKKLTQEEQLVVQHPVDAFHLVDDAI